jgi:hypothetical protein
MYWEVLAVYSEIRTEHINTLCRQNVEFLGAFAELRKATINFVMSVRLSVRPSIRMEQLCSHWADFYEI